MKKTVIIFLLFFALFEPSKGFAENNEQLIIINKSTNELAFFDNNKLVRTFSVGTGRSDGMTPEGSFKIVNKIINRPYYTDGIPGGSPRNPLGNRWLGLDAIGTYGTTYAIHGNNNPDSIGKYVSAGCVRMHNDEVEWLFEQVRLYTPVIIGHFEDDFESVANSMDYPIQPDVFVKFNEELVQFDDAPIKENGKVLVPMREFFEKINVNVIWNGSTKTIKAQDLINEIELQIDNKDGKVNGSNVTLEVPPKIINEKTYIPLRFVSETFQLKVNWDGATSTVQVLTGALPAVSEVETVNLSINNDDLKMINAYFFNHSLMVPVRDLIERLEANVSWEPETKAITVIMNNQHLQLFEGSDIFYLNGEKNTLQIPIQKRNGENYLPLRAVSENLGTTLSWDNETRTVFIKSN